MFDCKKHPGRWAAAALAVSVLAGSAWFRWLAVDRGEINFLERRAPAEWILYPYPPDAEMHLVADFETTFRRTFVLNAAPVRATLAIRGMKSWSLSINGRTAPVPANAGNNWKEVATLDVSSQLQPGTNEIIVTVYNTNGPPALWLALAADGSTVNSDADWDASLAGAAWRKSALSSAPVRFGRGNTLYGAEIPAVAFLRCLPAFLLFGAFSAGVFLCGRRWLAKLQEKGDLPGQIHSSRLAWLAVGIPVLLWVALFINNARLLPFDEGFDATHHLEYIKQIVSNWRLPRADQGWETYQPPLYYLVCAVLSCPFHQAASGTTGVVIIRMVGLAAGVAQFTLVFLSLRLLFPARAGLQCFGLILAALLPMNIYVSQYISNESLSAALVTAAVYFCLRIVKQDRDSPWLFAALGVCLGAALLTKYTGIVAVPVIGVALISRFVLKRRFSPRVWATTLGLSLFTTLAICGWYYLRVWWRFGTPLIGNWDPRIWHSWWMDRGYTTCGYFFRFGNCLAYPWFSGFNSFIGGLYSTLWGDGLLGGKMTLFNRTPWNYQFMAAGFLLALLPTLAILAGAAVSLWKFVRQPDPSGFLLIGLACSTLLALAYMTLKLPYCAQVKSFYGLIALLPLCAFGAAGWDLVFRRGKIIATVAAALFGIWAINSYASFWIRRGAPQTQMETARILESSGRTAEADQLYADILRRDPRNAAAGRQLAKSLFAQNNFSATRRMLEPILADAPDDAECHGILAMVLSAENQPDAAIIEAQKGVELAPDQPRAYLVLCDLLLKRGRNDDVINTGGEGLRAGPFSPELHYYFALACVNLGRNADALVHFRLALELDPKRPEAQEQLGMALSRSGQMEEARFHLAVAARMKPGEPSFHFNFAVALASLGNAPEAASEYRRVLQINPDDPWTLNDLAWILATHPDDRLRNGREAVQLAARACNLTQRSQPVFLTTLAAAQAEAGQFADAVASANEAIQVAQTAGNQPVASINEKLLELYRANQPYRQLARPADLPPH